MSIKDGSTVRFWTDIWYPQGRLIEIVGELGTHKLGVKRNALIYDVLVGGKWQFRRCRDNLIQDLVRKIKEVSLNLVDNV